MIVTNNMHKVFCREQLVVFSQRQTGRWLNVAMHAGRHSSLYDTERHSGPQTTPVASSMMAIMAYLILFIPPNYQSSPAYSSILSSFPSSSSSSDSSAFFAYLLASSSRSLGTSWWRPLVGPSGPLIHVISSSKSLSLLSS